MVALGLILKFGHCVPIVLTNVTFVSSSNRILFE